MINIPIGVLSLSEPQKTNLKSRGILFLQDLLDQDEQSACLLGNEDDIKEFTAMPRCQTALQVWKKETSRRRIITFSKHLDSALGGGVELQSITEFSGAPGTGKTQLCHQLCIDVQLPQSAGGVHGQALYIDTNFGFSKTRLEELAASCESHCQWMKRAKKIPGIMPSSAQLLNGVHIFSAPTGSLTELLATVTSLSDVLLTMPQVRLVVIDSFSKPFLLHSDKLSKRTALIFDVLNTLQNISWDFNVAVVTTSQLTTQIQAEGEAKVVPGLGQGYAHRVPHRVLLGLVHQGAETRRAAQVLKSPARPRQTTYFQITKSGIRDEGVTT